MECNTLNRSARLLQALSTHGSLQYPCKTDIWNLYILKHPHFVGGVEGELGQVMVPEHQEATFHGNYLPWKLGHACTVGTWELPKLIYSVLPPNSLPSSSECPRLDYF